MPTQESSMIDKLSTLLAKPKSDSLKTPLFMRILAGLRSLWMIPDLINS